ncbi:hypothetical protein D7Y13_10050 [Corallococcus praedator]|uniref:Uncharacterized protein n=1 Tax=Corallococcus praedator TaxID=2316724 RepID=A0ABX9QNC7_9BACT|nr:hypothetical protein D7Y13_10050 [Corallococcus praedator]
MRGISSCSTWFRRGFSRFTAMTCRMSARIATGSGCPASGTSPASKSATPRARCCSISAVTSPSLLGKYW